MGRARARLPVSALSTPPSISTCAASSLDLLPAGQSGLCPTGPGSSTLGQLVQSPHAIDTGLSLHGRVNNAYSSEVMRFGSRSLNSSHRCGQARRLSAASAAGVPPLSMFCPPAGGSSPGRSVRCPASARVTCSVSSPCSARRSMLRRATTGTFECTDEVEDLGVVLLIGQVSARVHGRSSASHDSDHG